MTTAARPTFDPAKGGTGRGEKSLSSLSKQYSSRDLPSHTSLKYRQTGQNTTDELKKKDFKRELEERERLALLDKDGKRTSENVTSTSRGALPSSSSAISSSTDSSSSKKPRLEYQNLSQLDADEKLDDDSDDDVDNDEDVDSDSDSDEDDTQALLAELNRIKKERAAEEAKREEERRLQENKIRMENILSGNPLLSSAKSTDFKVKRRWDDDVVFKNCAKDEPNQKRGFINDTLRSDFHRKFMEKYIK